MIKMGIIGLLYKVNKHFVHVEKNCLFTSRMLKIELEVNKHFFHLWWVNPVVGLPPIVE